MSAATDGQRVTRAATEGSTLHGAHASGREEKVELLALRPFRRTGLLGNG